MQITKCDKYGKLADWKDCVNGSKDDIGRSVPRNWIHQSGEDCCPTCWAELLRRGTGRTSAMLWNVLKSSLSHDNKKVLVLVGTHHEAIKQSRNFQTCVGQNARKCSERLTTLWNGTTVEFKSIALEGGGESDLRFVDHAAYRVFSPE